MGLKRSLAVISTTAILAGSAIFSPEAIAPESKDYEGNIIYIASSPAIESRLKAEDAIIVIDPGHDDKYVGYHQWSKRGTIKEESLNLSLSKKLETILTESGGTVYLTRNSGERVNVQNLDLNGDKKINLKDELIARANYINSINPDCALIIHYNAYPKSSKVNGMEIYFYGIRSERQLEDNRLNFTKPENCRIYSRSSMLFADSLGQYMREQGIKVSVIGSDMRVLRENPDRTLVLLEVGYMTNTSDLNTWATSEGQDKIAFLLKHFLNDNIRYIKQLNETYPLKENLEYIMKPQVEKDSTNLIKLMDKNWRTHSGKSSSQVSPPLEHPF